MSYLSILIASLLGSPHCAGMCGGFAAWSGSGGLRWSGVAAYNLGRLITYITLGIIAGLLGKSLDTIGDTLGINRLAFILVAVLMLFWGFFMLLRATPPIFPTSVIRTSGTSNLSTRTNATAKTDSKWFTQIARLAASPLRLVLQHRGRPAAEARATIWFPLLLGISSTLLPCGWLYVYVAVAAGAGSLLGGAGVMFIFWIGTLPMMLSVGSLSKVLSPPLLRLMPVCTALLLMLGGFLSLRSHWNTQAAPTINTHPPATCHTNAS